MEPFTGLPNGIQMEALGMMPRSASQVAPSFSDSRGSRPMMKLEKPFPGPYRSAMYSRALRCRCFVVNSRFPGVMDSPSLSSQTSRLHAIRSAFISKYRSMTSLDCGGVMYRRTSPVSRSLPT